MNTTGFILPASVRRLAGAGLSAATLFVAGAASPAISTAAPVWDIEEYDYCMRQTSGLPSGGDPIAKEEENDRYCCDRSGGVWNGLTCASPPAEGAGAGVLPPKVGLPTVQVRPPIEPGPKPPAARPTVPVLPPKAS